LNGSTSIGDRITKLMDLKVPEGLLGKLSHAAAKLLEVAKFPPRVKSRARRVSGSGVARRRDRPRQAADHHLLARTTAARISRCRW
jgi:hypothetical protein